MSANGFPRPIRTASRFSGLLVASAIGVYVLILLGATTSITDAALSCSTWPLCGVPADPLNNIELTVVWAHRLTALLVGILVVLATVSALVGPPSRRVTIALATVCTLYFVQIGIGGVLATTDLLAAAPGLHLLVGVLIFIGVIVALALELERTTGSDDESVTRMRKRAGRPEADPVESPTSLESSIRTTTIAYIEMMKPRLMWLLCLVAAAGMALAAGPSLDRYTIVATLGGGILAIGASGTFNHVLERDVDRYMSRTNDRPVVTSVIPVRNAVAFGAVLTVASVSIFATINVLAAALGLIAIVFYSVIYTLILKPHSVQNTVIGGFAGALPALIGWAAVTNEIGLPALALAGVIFLWTPAHFYNLALAYKEDYARGGFPMLPVVRGETVTRKHIIYYIGATLVGATVLAWITDLGLVYTATVLVVGGVFLVAARNLHYDQTERAAFRTFHASNLFLGALLFSVLIDAMVVV